MVYYLCPSIGGSGRSIWGADVVPQGYCGASLLVGMVASRHILFADGRQFDGAWGAMPGGGVMACTPVSSHVV